MSAEDLDQNRARAVQLEKEWNRAGFSFISSDLETSLTFATLALEAQDDEEKRKRNRANARKGYDAVLYFLNRFNRSTVSPEAIAEIEAKIKKLKSMLQNLGETLP